MSVKSDKWPPVHPGEVLLHEFLEPLDMSPSQLAKAISVPPQRVTAIIKMKGNITGDMALRLSRYFGNSAQFWINLQGRYELETAKDELEDRLEREVAVRAA